jgi:DNA-binding MarR family transcriptional regulator
MRLLERVQAEIDLLRAALPSFDPGIPIQEVSPAWIHAMLHARRRREEIISKGIFNDPAWDLLLVLYAARLANDRTRVTDLCRLAGIPDATALRWIEKLEQESLVLRNPDEADRRQVFIELSPRGFALMNNFFREPQGAGLAL